MNDLQRLIAIEAIKTLKARYFQGQWNIATLRLTRLRVDITPAGDLAKV